MNEVTVMENAVSVEKLTAHVELIKNDGVQVCYGRMASITASSLAVARNRLF